MNDQKHTMNILLTRVTTLEQYNSDLIAALAYCRTTMRDEFAKAALIGMLAYPGCESWGTHHNNNTPSGVAEGAYTYADAMIVERIKKSGV